MNIVLTKNRIRRATEQLREEVMPNDRAIDQPTDNLWHRLENSRQGVRSTLLNTNNIARNYARSQLLQKSLL